MNNDNFTVLVSEGSRPPLSEQVYCVAVTFKMTEQVEQQICIKFCIKLEHSSMGNYSDYLEGCSYGQLVTGSFITTMHPLTHHVSCRVFGKTSNQPGDSTPLQPRFGALQLLAFPRTKITFEREEISDHQ